MRPFHQGLKTQSLFCFRWRKGGDVPKGKDEGMYLEVISFGTYPKSFFLKKFLLRWGLSLAPMLYYSFNEAVTIGAEKSSTQSKNSPQGEELSELLWRVSDEKESKCAIVWKGIH
ncbi:hypothetical protein CEXT_87881 [Caerostris extrusa]|uniref:Uncharacterized protein n=1 Tax=Caerostris extrusa TaxID=172846 RepID=A0AAV4XPV2_CAEEX|nr:hypothetical protein CEXT_87881 [Caerostris extrusa]